MIEFEFEFDMISDRKLAMNGKVGNKYWIWNKCNTCEREIKY